MEAVLKGVLKRITPTPAEKEKIEQVLEKIKAGVEKVVAAEGLTYTLAGSYTRDTYMKDKKEFDIFLMFPEDTPREELEKRGLETGKKIVRTLKGTYIIAYAEHPYVRSEVSGYSLDLVPCYRLRSADRIKSAVDRTPFHNKWLKKNFTPVMSPQTRLLKQLCKGQGIYGSDTRVQGLSGYLCELLIVHYGSFGKFLKAAAEWEAGQVFIDTEGHSRPETMKKFKGEPLVVIDPVDSKRNVASALSPPNFVRLSDASKRFLLRPSSSFFFKRAPKITAGMLEKRMKKRKTQFLGIVFPQPQIIQDVLWPQLRRGARRLKDILEDHEFHVMGFDVWSDPEFTRGQCIIMLEMEVWDLPDVRKVVGPPVFIKARSDEFLKKYRPDGRIMVEDDRWVAEVKRKWKTAEGMVRHSMSDPEKTLLEKGIPSYIAKAVPKKFRLLDQKGILNLAKKKPGVGEFLLDYLKKEVL